MAIEMGAKAGLVAPDETTFNYVEGRLHHERQRFRRRRCLLENPANRRRRNFGYRCHCYCGTKIPPVTWGTNPGQVISVNDNIPIRLRLPIRFENARRQKKRWPMGLKNRAFR
ncbi:aconitase family protein [Escherichia coli]